MRTISNRKDIEVPQEYVRHFEVPADAHGQALVDKITEKFGNNWRYLELTDLDFTGATMGGVVFTGATMGGVVFTGATLTDVDFSDAKLNAVDFTGATLTSVGVFDATLTDVGFYKAKLTWVSFSEATLTDVGFYKAKLTDVTFREATLNNVGFGEATMKDVSFGDATLTGTKNINFTGTKYTCSIVHERVRVIPEIVWDKQPIAAVLPEGDQPLLISIGCKTHTPDEWMAFTPGELGEMDSRAPDWHKAHMEEAVRRAREIEKEYF